MPKENIVHEIICVYTFLSTENNTEFVFCGYVILVYENRSHNYVVTS